MRAGPRASRPCSARQPEGTERAGHQPLETEYRPHLARCSGHGVNWSEDAAREELDNNAQGLLGYVVRWIDQGVGCSKVPDINDVGLMEDRATLVHFQPAHGHWLLYGVANNEQVMDSLKAWSPRSMRRTRRPAIRADGRSLGRKPAFRAACDLVFNGVEQPNGRTEPLLHAWRLKKKAALAKVAEPA